MTTLQQITKQLDIATIDGTSMDNFDNLLTEYKNIYDNQPTQYKIASKNRFNEIINSIKENK